MGATKVTTTTLPSAIAFMGMGSWNESQPKPYHVALTIELGTKTVQCQEHFFWRQMRHSSYVIRNNWVTFFQQLQRLANYSLLIFVIQDISECVSPNLVQLLLQADIFSSWIIL
jgi:hypothetical protein